MDTSFHFSSRLLLFLRKKKWVGQRGYEISMYNSKETFNGSKK